ncbi:hypothetical protein ACFWBB_13390 [Streptomyces sp. NPDC060000]|uniref:hypothetical protein n=1 Tax=Streptomyces sp. NPDC060000 TaxID=3347031 RepID=UPI0036BED882
MRATVTPHPAAPRHAVPSNSGVNNVVVEMALHAEESSRSATTAGRGGAGRSADRRRAVSGPSPSAVVRDAVEGDRCGHGRT